MFAHVYRKATEFGVCVMSFWYIFFILLIALLCILPVLKKCSQEILVISVTIVVILISGLRNNIGSDFQTYILLYDTFSKGTEVGAEIELSFQYLSHLLGMMDFKYQTIFVIYSSIIIGGMYLGYKSYFGDFYVGIMLGMMLYFTYNSTGGFWWGMNCIRQAAAMSVVFAGARFLYENRDKYFLLSVLVASFLHYSALVSLPAVFLKNCNLNRKYVIITLFCSLFVTYIGLSKTFVMYGIEIMTSVIGKYEAAVLLVTAGDKSFSYMSFVYVLMYLFSFYMVKQGKDNYKIIFNLSTVFIIMRILTSFSLGGPSIQYILHRFEVYYLPFFFIHVCLGLLNFSRRFKPFFGGWVITMIFITILSFLTLETIASVGGEETTLIEPRYPGENIEYDYNIDVF